MPICLCYYYGYILLEQTITGKNLHRLTIGKRLRGAKRDASSAFLCTFWICWCMRKKCVKKREKHQMDLKRPKQRNNKETYYPLVNTEKKDIVLRSLLWATGVPSVCLWDSLSRQFVCEIRCVVSLFVRFIVPTVWLWDSLCRQFVCMIRCAVSLFVRFIVPTVWL